MSEKWVSRYARLSGGAVVVLMIAGCASVPDRPVAEAAPAVGDAFRAGASSDPVSSEWWAGFSDPVLASLVNTTLQASPALRGADFSVAEAEAALRLALLGASPTASTRAGITAGRPTGTSADRLNVSATGTLAASWEFDAFGRIAALVEAARYDAATARELRRDIAVTLASETALAYINLRGAEARLEVGRRNAQTQVEGLELVRTLFDNGRATQLDIEQAETLYRTTLASLPVYEADREAAISRLAALTAAPASSADALLQQLTASPGLIPALEAPMTAGTPEDLLRRRPDIRAAEAQVGAALALGEVARADLFPRITLNANLLGLVRNTGVAVSDESLGFDFGPAITWAGPDLRGVYANIDATDARTGQIIANYQSTVLDALADAETALTDLASENRRTADLEAALASARRALDLARLRYREGLDSYLNVLDAQRSLLDAEDRLAVNRAETARRAVRAYRSLGGIWTDEELAAYRAG
ncbi:RND efflux system, outer membrane lipoprotein, NodT family [Hyphomonas neptunium ATCC 15444]|uniref:RND efflux system, outer membrane lipoprotein, NodT family n=2 Tax=Hyphomonas TaxID=85 RepID=Q0C5P7_HYPNA|nr:MULTISPECIES: TolC family protein [Hyphomonas]ABI78123.1 RND efflux system, outer membrane lipoprotein, NodT family [Hyphomonas neptunium ATCC 15444]